MDHIIRTTLRPGDLSYIMQAHYRWYFPNHGYTEAFEYYVARALVESYEQTKENTYSRWWIVDLGDKPMGSLVLMDRGKGHAQLRFFIIEEELRGQKLGKKLISLFIEHLRKHNFTYCYLWTTTEQLKARALYKSAGFREVEQQTSHNFGVEQIELKYELHLK